MAFLNHFVLKCIFKIQSDKIGTFLYFSIHYAHSLTWDYFKINTKIYQTSLFFELNFLYKS